MSVYAAKADWPLSGKPALSMNRAGLCNVAGGRVSQAALSERGFKLLEDLGTIPKVTYLKGGAPNGRNS